MLVGVALVGALVEVVVTDMVAIVGVVIVVEVEIEFFPLIRASVVFYMKLEKKIWKLPYGSSRGNCT